MENAQEIIERNTEYLRITVSLFMRKCRQEHRNGMLNREDLFQEAAICFLGEVERYGEETAKTHGRTLHHTLWEAVREAYPLKISYDSFSKAKRQPLKVEPLHGLEHMLAKADPTEKIDTRLDFAAKLEDYPVLFTTFMSAAASVVTAPVLPTAVTTTLYVELWAIAYDATVNESA